MTGPGVERLVSFFGNVTVVDVSARSERPVFTARRSVLCQCSVIPVVRPRGRPAAAVAIIVSVEAAVSASMVKGDGNVFLDPGGSGLFGSFVGDGGTVDGHLVAVRFTLRFDGDHCCRVHIAHVTAMAVLLAGGGPGRSSRGTASLHRRQ